MRLYVRVIQKPGAQPQTGDRRAQVVRDGGLITSRNPGDLEAFSDALLKSLS